MNKNTTTLRSVFSPIAMLIACLLVGNSDALASDWNLEGGDWILKGPLVGDSDNARTTGFAALEAMNFEDVTIESGGSWDVEIKGVAAIALQDLDTMTLNGDLTIEKGSGNYMPFTAGVLFKDGGLLRGDAKLTVESSSVDAPASILTAGVVANGNLDISNFDGEVEVTNDNSGGIGIGLQDSAASVGIVALNFEDLMKGICCVDLDTFIDAFVSHKILGKLDELDQTIVVSSESNDLFSYWRAVIFSKSVGVIGNIDNGITDGANISASATGGTSNAESFYGSDATAATSALAVGVGGAVSSITGDVSIATFAETGNAVAVVGRFNKCGMKAANADSIAVATGVAGLVGDINAGEDAVVSIRAEADAGDATAVGPKSSNAITAAVARGLGAGVVGTDFWETDTVETDAVGGIAGAEIIAFAETGDAKASSYRNNSSATNLASAAAVGGFVSGNVSGSTLTAFAESGDATADDTSKDASADTVVVSGGVIGLIEGTLTDTAIEVASVSGNAEAVSEGEESNGNADANSTAFAAGILGGVNAVSEENGLVTINVSATSGDADANGYAADPYASSSAMAYGIAGFDAVEDVVDGLSNLPGSSYLTDLVESSDSYTTTGLAGTINVTAVAGNATADTSGDDDAFIKKMSEGVYSGSYAVANASATGFSGDITGDVTAKITATATGGSAETNAYAQAMGIDGAVSSEEVSAEIVVAATGGTVIFSGIMAPYDTLESNSAYEADASAFAGGIVGPVVDIGIITGDITVTATPGLVEPSLGVVVDSAEPNGGPELPDLDESLAVVDSAFAAGIMTYDEALAAKRLNELNTIESEPDPLSLLNVAIGSRVHAFVEAPEGQQLSAENSYAAAIYSGQGSDRIELAEGAYIIGDINTGGNAEDGPNKVIVTGNAIMRGNILSSSVGWVDEQMGIDNGAGTVDFDIEPGGMFTAVGAVNVSNLANALEIAEGGGIAPILPQYPSDGTTSLISIHGNNGQAASINIAEGNIVDGAANVNIAEGAVVRPIFASDVKMTNLMKHGYTIIDTEGTIMDNGAIVDNSHGPFEYSLQVVSDTPVGTIEEGVKALSEGGEAYVLTVERVKDQDGEHTPGTVQSNQAAGTASQAVMHDISEHASLLRSLLRSPSTSTGSAPTGAAGPNLNKMRKGEWLAYINVFGNIGSQDSGNGYAGFDYDTYGAVIGMEKLVGPQLILALAGSYANTDIDGKQNSGGGESDLYSGVVYGNFFTDTWYVDGGFTYGRADNDVYRIDFEGDRYHGDYYSNLFGTWIETGYAVVGFGNFGLEPYGRVTYTYADNDGFTDEGPDDEVMTTEDYHSDNFKTEIGTRVTYECAYKEHLNLLLEVKAAWQHEWADRNVSVNATYLGDSTLRIESANANRDALVLGINGELTCDNGISIGLEYAPTIAGNWHNHAFSGTLQYNW